MPSDHVYSLFLASWFNESGIFSPFLTYTLIPRFAHRNIEYCICVDQWVVGMRASKWARLDQPIIAWSTNEALALWAKACPLVMKPRDPYEPLLPRYDGPTNDNLRVCLGQRHCYCVV
ncbi:hypothetical protein KFK09_024284 [Dendrobium nobile]|uniref:Uncharacterized protein n=1 Tax=Dendrobium nobile TaxID=94219 RepID=A0A8T3ADM7_DENNO|nr:hypothetical protein KFK09_024284 [Dendrobium nobile]